MKEIALNVKQECSERGRENSKRTKPGPTPASEDKQLFKLRSVSKSTIELEKYEADQTLKLATNSAFKSLRSKKRTIPQLLLWTENPRKIVAKVAIPTVFIPHKNSISRALFTNFTKKPQFFHRT